MTLVIMVIVSCSTIKSSKYNEKNSDTSIHYSLPKTYINFVVEFERKEITPSKYQEFAKCYGMIAKEETKSVTFAVKSINIATESQLDKDNIYQTKIIDGFLNKNEFSLQYASNGELTSADYKTSNVTTGIITKVIELGTGIFTPAAVAGASGDEDACIATLSIDSINAKIIKEKLVLLKNYNSNLDKIISDVDYQDHEILKFQYGKNTEKKKELLSSYFTHKVKKETIKLKFKVDPYTIMNGNNSDGGKTPYQNKKFILFQYNKKGDNTNQGGIIDNKKVADKIWNRKKYKNMLSDLSKMTNVVVYLDTNKKYINAISSDSISEGKGSFYYRIPSNNIVTIHEDIDTSDTEKGKLIFNSDNVLLTQYGIVIAAPANLGDAKFELYPKTGALKSISGKSSNIDLEQLDALKSQVLATQKAIQGNEEIDDEITKLKKEVELLELLEKKEELEKEESDDEN